MKAHVRATRPFKISACTIAKNEEDNIARSLDSYRDFVDEIIVVDTGSTDGTVRIAEQCGATVLHFDWCDDFAAAKNFALDQANGDWIVFLDADEYFCPDCGKRLREAIAIAEQRGNNCVGCRMKNIDRVTGESRAEVFQIRLFQKGLRYRYPIHESLCTPDGTPLSPLTVHESWFFLYHTGYSSDLNVQKGQRNVALLERQLEKEADPAKQCVLHLYLCDSYFSMNDYVRAKAEALLYFQDKDTYHVQVTGLQVKAYLNLIHILQKDNPFSYQEEEKWVERLASDFPQHPDALCCQGHLFTRKHLFKQALDKLRQAEQLAESYDDLEMNSAKVQGGNLACLRGLCCEGVGDLGNAFDFYLEGLKQPGSNIASTRFFYLLKQQKPEDVQIFLKGIIRSLNDGQMKRLMAGLMVNYMSEALLLCYAKYRTDQNSEQLDANITAFIKAGQGQYREAAALFLVRYQIDHEENTAMRALLCARLAQDADYTEQTLRVAPPYSRILLGEDAFEIEPEWVPKLAGLVAEIDRIKGRKQADALARLAVAKMDQEMAKNFALALENLCEYPEALIAIHYAPRTPDTLFLRGYYTYRMGRIGEAEDRIRLAKAWGYTEPDADAMLDLIAERLRAFRADKCPDIPGEQARVTKQIEQGKFMVARASLDMLRELAEPDAAWYSLTAVAHYCLGQDEQAVLTVEAGLSRFPDDVDLAYNAGDIYKRMGLHVQARAYYQQALERCGDTVLSEQIRQAMASAPS
ncbi:MAG: glycosyltransferase family 2 protein [Ethanoligenens sp.]